MRVAFAGTPEFALPALTALSTHHELVGVLTQPDRPRGRGRKLSASAVKAAAAELGVPLAQPETLRSEAARAPLQLWQPEVLVVVAYGLMLPREVLALPRFGCLNIHASLLPRWRGAAPVERAILAGDSRTGVSIMQMDAALDTGPVLLERELAIGPRHTGGTLQQQLAVLGATALLEALAGLAGGTLEAKPQPADGATYAAKIHKAEARIDWNASAAAIDRQVRAFNPRPIAQTELDGGVLRIFSAHPAVNVEENAAKSFEPGAIVGVSDDFMTVQCGQGRICIETLQRPGRNVVAVRDFARATSLTGRRFG